MADVFLAQLGGMSGFTKVAVLKRLRAKLEHDDDFLQMFMDEARLAARLNHPNIVQTFEVGADDHGPFLTMEFLEGQSLSAILKRGQRRNNPLPLASLVAVLQQVLAGLHYAHELADFDGTPLGIVHRDVTPQNIFVTYGGISKLVDFGVAKAASASVETRAGVLKGKVAYMAPEQARASRDLDRRADIFSVGVILWEALAGKRFWSGAANDLQILTSLNEKEPFPEPTREDGAPPAELVAVCMKAVAREASHRYATADEFMRALEVAARSLDLHSTQSELGAYVNDMFAEEREKLRKAVESRIRQPQAEVPSDAIAPLLEGPHSRMGSMYTSPGSASMTQHLAPSGGAPVSSPAPSTTPVGVTTELAREAVARDAAVRDAVAANTRTLAIALVVGLGLLGVVLAVVLRRGDAPVAANPPAQSNGPATQDSMTAPVVSHAPVERPNTMVRVRFAATPSQAKLSLDGAPLPSNPYEGSLPRDERPHVLLAEAPNFKTESARVSLESDATVQLALGWLGSGAAPVVPHGKAPATTGKPETGGPTTPPAPPPPAKTSGGGIQELDHLPGKKPGAAPTIDTNIFGK
jgi:serine/threonine-protein kinase